MHQTIFKLRYIISFIISLFTVSCAEKQTDPPERADQPKEKVTMMTLDPGHFHAALVQKAMYPQVDSTIYVFAPNGPELEDFLTRIDQYNSRKKHPTAWKVEKYSGADYLQQMVAQKPGNVMVVAGKNSKKVDYILEAVKAGLNVYADKPLVIDPKGFTTLLEAFKVAEKNGVLIYDIMTERFESTTMMQKLFSGLPTVFGELVDGSPENPSISKESVHHFFKYVSGKPLVRPAWFFDVEQEGEGIVDVTTHLVDLVQWEAFPNQIIDSSEIEILQAKRWPTVLTEEEFTHITKLDNFPDYLQKDIVDVKLHTYSNGEILYKIKNKHAKVSVIWNYKAPEGTGDTHYSMMRGTKSDLIIKQGPEEGYKPVLYIRPKTKDTFDTVLKNAVDHEVQGLFPGTTAEKMGTDLWKINIPDTFKIGHEAHFAQVTENYLAYLKSGKPPEWEVPNMITKYYTTIAAYKKAQSN